MYTRCPECRTPFRVTRTQLNARDGLVRCGKCHAVFSAPEHLLWFAPSADAATEAVQGAQAPERRTRSRRGRKHGEANDPAIPTISALPWARRRRRLHPLWLGLINAALVIALAGQGLYFYSNELARHPLLQPLVNAYCGWLSCRIDIADTWTAPELGTTTIAPHPRFANALRLRGVLVSRTHAPVPHPRMEIVLTDNSGAVLARRIFEPRDYLELPSVDMQPNVAVPILIDLTNPDGRAVGYEIQLLPPRQTIPN